MIFDADNTDVPGIYQIRNMHNGRVYVGQAACIKIRWAAYCAPITGKRRFNRFMYNDYKKCLTLLGHDDFMVFTILERMPGATKQERVAREAAHIAAIYDDQIVCYNIQKDSICTDRCFSLSPAETSSKITAALKASWQDPVYRAHMLTKRRDPSFRQAISVALTGRKTGPVSDTTREKMRVVRLAVWEKKRAEGTTHHKNPHPPITAETRAKLSASAKGRKASPETLAKMSVARAGHVVTEETRAKIAAALTGRKRESPSPETRAKQSAAMTGRVRTEEHKRNIGNVHRGRKRSAETCARIRAAQVNRAPITDATRARLSVSGKGHEVTEETRRKIGEGHRRRLAILAQKAEALAEHGGVVIHE